MRVTACCCHIVAATLEANCYFGILLLLGGSSFSPLSRLPIAHFHRMKWPSRAKTLLAYT